MQPDTIVINGKLRLSLTEVLPLDAPEWLEHTINSSTAVSNLVIQQLYSLFQFKNEQTAKSYGLGNPATWGIYRRVLKKHNSSDYFRDQITLFIFPEPNKYIKLFIAPVRESKASILEELEKARNVTQLMGQIGDLELVNIETIPFKANPYQKKQGKGKSQGNKPAGSRPFAQLDKLVHTEPSTPLPELTSADVAAAIANFAVPFEGEIKGFGSETPRPISDSEEVVGTIDSSEEAQTPEAT